MRSQYQPHTSHHTAYITLLLLSDLHGIYPCGCKSLSDPAHLQCRADQTLQRQEDWRAVASYLRYRGQLLSDDEKKQVSNKAAKLSCRMLTSNIFYCHVQTEPVHRHQWRVRGREDGEHQADPPVPGSHQWETLLDRAADPGHQPHTGGWGSLCLASLNNIYHF